MSRHHCAWQRPGNGQHEAAATACRLEHLLCPVGDLNGAAAHGHVVARRGTQTVMEEFFAGDFRQLSVFVCKQMNEPDRRRVGRHDPLLKLCKREAVGQFRHVIAGIARKPNSLGFGRHSRYQAFPKCQRFAFCLADDSAARPENPDCCGSRFSAISAWSRSSRCLAISGTAFIRPNTFSATRAAARVPRGSFRPE